MNKTTCTLAALGALLGASTMHAVSLDLNKPGLVHGTILDTQFLTSDGVTISATNIGGGPDLAVIFDTEARGTRDNDLEGPNGTDGSWSGGGNMPSNTRVGNAIIIQENNVGTGDGVADLPDDEGSRPAGSIVFDFGSNRIDSFGFDLIDVEGPDEYGRDSGFFASFYDPSDTLLHSIGFGSLIITDGADYGNNSLNRIAPISFHGASFRKVEINFGGSAAITNINYSRVPDSGSTALLLLSSALALLVASRKRLQR